jgi:hypothetical protein
MARLNVHIVPQGYAPTKCSAYVGGKDQEGPGKANVVADASSRKSYEKAVPKSAQLQEEMA